MVADIPKFRLQNQQIAGSRFKNPHEIVAWMGAMQAQDYNMAKWAVGIRLPGLTDPLVEQAIDEGKIIRTHLLRPTWHLVSSDDIHWILELTAPHVKRLMRARHKELGLTDQIVTQSKLLVEKALAGGVHQTRDEIITRLQNAGLVSNREQVSHLMLICELDGLICSGATKGKKQTYALLEERVPKPAHTNREEALAKLANRYFTSHGPATILDFIWWSGLPVKDARKALEMVKPGFASEEINNQEYWFAVSGSPPTNPENSAFLLPAYDEYIISYKDRTAMLHSENHKKAISDNGFFRPVVVVNGRAIGTWKRIQKKDQSIIEIASFGQENHISEKIFGNTLKQYGQFINQEANMVFQPTSGN